MWKQFINEYFVFTRKERRGVIFIVVLIVALSFYPFIYSYFSHDDVFYSSDFEAEIAALKIDSGKKQGYKNYAENEYYNDYTPYKKKVARKVETFHFDPNTASLNEWVRLGIREKIAQNIQNYISKGGKFYKPEDLKKIWGIPKSDVDRLMPYMKIENLPNKYPKYEKVEYAKNYTPRTISSVDINTGDSSAFIALPGIGSRLSQRIISFRERLGGFHSITQIAETYYLHDSVFQKIRPYLVVEEGKVKRININHATVDEMKRHPYIQYPVANAIFNYRNQHGNFKSIEGLKKIMIISDEMFSKMAPYLTVD
ncbi:MAG: helix-hairpin-helix domain-containing protein [Ginsengibacter sp.]|jgi:competence ComEA-like helix-hairpin-helix protein